MDKNITQYLWYIIPGALALFPLGIKFYEKLQGIEGLLAIVICFTIGYIIHQIYRLIYGLFFFNNRNLIVKLKNLLDKKFNLNIPKEKIDPLYNYFIYSAEEFSSQIHMIKKRSHNLSSIFSCKIGLVIGIIILIISLFIHKISYINFLILSSSYIITLLIFILLYSIYYKIMTQNEIVLIINNIEKFDKVKIEKILKEL
ncbi:MAG: hypothetical protein P8X70_00970 [Nanoarchaeota archaeon]